MAETPVWAFSMFDWDGPWGMPALGQCDCRKHVEMHLAHYERMTWAQILHASGGKKTGTNNHPLEVSNTKRPSC
jgi:hypothetical protein